MRLIDADKLNRKDINSANIPMNFIDTAPTVKAISIEVVEQIKNSLEKMPFYFGTTFHGETIKTVDVDKVIEMLDEAIKEVEHGALFDKTNGR